MNTEALSLVRDRLEELCNRYNYQYWQVSSEPNIHTYYINNNQIDELINELEQYSKEQQINIKISIDNKGTSIKLTKKALLDGHWKYLGKKPKRQDYSMFVNPEDAKKVRDKKTIYQDLTLPQKIDKAIKEEKRPKTIAVDLDGTIARHYTKYNNKEIPEPRPGVQKALSNLRSKGYRVIINTVRGNKKLIQKYLEDNNIPYDQINFNPDQPKDSSDKICADVYVDDKSIDGRKSWNKLEQEIEKRLKEDQIKSPTGKHRRSQSMFRSSFRKSKTFGGVTEAIAGSSIPFKKEPSTHIDKESGARTDAPGENKKFRPYNKRKDATDNPDIIDPDIIERTIPGTKLGRTNDTTQRSLTTNKIIPGSTAPDTDGPEDVLGNDLSSRIDQVIQADIAAQEKADPLNAMAKKQNMRPLGLFGPRDLRAPTGGSISNVRIKHPRDRSYDDNSPKITIDKTK